MDEKLSEEAKPKITRSRARHIRRKRLTSARRAAENESSIATNVESERSNDSKSSEDRRDTEALSKSKARRLRKRNKTGTVKVLGKNSDDKTDIQSSPSHEFVKKVSTDVVIAKSTSSTIETEYLDEKKNVIGTTKITNEPVSGRVVASERELFENEKNRKISEKSRSTGESDERITDNYESGLTTTGARREMSLDCPTSVITISRATVIDEFAISLGSVEESQTIRETIISSKSAIREDETSNDVKALPNLTRETQPRARETSEKNVGRMNSQEKTREQVKAEREAKKAAKAAAKSGKGKVPKSGITENSTPTKPIVEIATKQCDEPRGDVVDGEIVPMMCKLAITSTSKIKPDVFESVPSVESRNELKSKSELRAERRAKQEAQRAVKLGQAPQTNKPKPSTNLIAEKKESSTTTTTTTLPPKRAEDSAKKSVKRAIVKENAHEVSLFKHLYHEREQALVSVPTVNSNIHPAIVRLGVQYAGKIIVGSNARCVALLTAVKQLIKDFERPSQADFTRGLEASLQESSAYLHHCRPLAVSMQNALRHLKWQMTQLSATTSDEEAKTKLGNAIDTYIQEQIHLADKAISITIQTKISHGDVILTYGYSSLIYKILCDAYDVGGQFRVVVVDGRPWLEGREQLRRLVKHGLECSYVLINALSFIMPEVSKVFLGAHAILANGAVMSRVGTAQVALMAKSFNVPVLVACETHKTCERVQTDSIVYNEIADADELAKNPMGSAKKTSLTNWRAKKSLNLLNITYDVTPGDLVTAVVTELAILPCTSVPTRNESNYENLKSELKGFVKRHNG